MKKREEKVGGMSRKESKGNRGEGRTREGKEVGGSERGMSRRESKGKGNGRERE